jgi:hypothetical protein
MVLSGVAGATCAQQQGKGQSGLKQRHMKSVHEGKRAQRVGSQMAASSGGAAHA